MAVVEVEALEKRYGDVHALKGIRFALEGKRIGLLGPNGAGKSSLLKILLGLVHPDHGQVRVFGRAIEERSVAWRSHLGYMAEGDAVLPGLSALDYVTLAGELCALPSAEAKNRAHQVLYYVGLGDARYRQLGSFSTGMKQRARLAQALVGDPRLLLLDEPTNGLDPMGREEMLTLIRDIPERTGATVLLSSHILQDVERTCDQVLVLAGGELLYDGPLQPLVTPERGSFEVRVKGDAKALKAPLEAARCGVRVLGPTLEVHVPEGEGANLILKIAVQSGLQIRHLAPLERTLERAFFSTIERRAPAHRAQALRES